VRELELAKNGVIGDIAVAKAEVCDDAYLARVFT
jgi:hypothetical protein